MRQPISTVSDQMVIRRQARRLARARIGKHPIAHVDPDKCYEWMRSECAALDVARQAREDGLIGTITQISSTALLAIPGLIFGSDQSFPEFLTAKMLYFGIAAFLITLLLSMVEQYLSAKAYRLQTQIVREYYALTSETTRNEAFVKWVRWCRNAACVMFAASVVLSTTALITLERKTNGKPASTTHAAASATSAAAPPSSSPTTSSSKPRLRRLRSEVGSRLGSATPAEKIAP